VALASGCTNHPERPAIALCMACGAAVCQECATTRDGIHYCASCLAGGFEAAGARISWLGWLASLVAAVGLVFALTRLMVWFGVLMAETL
jgi:hypothetical protein